MFLTGFLIFFGCFEISGSFPINCVAHKMELYFVLDCRWELEGQTSFIENFTEYLQHNRQMNLDSIRVWINTDNGIVNVSNIQEISEMKFDCYNPVKFTQFIKEIETHSINSLASSLYIIFFSNMTYAERNFILRKNAMYEVESIQTYFHMFVIALSYSESELQMNSLDLVHFTSTFSDINVSTIVSKMCVIKCQESNIKYTSAGNISTSYYYIADKLNVSSFGAHGYCASRKSYLLSLESNEEVYFIFQLIHNLTLTNHYTNLNGVHLGLRRSNSSELVWRSGRKFYHYNSYNLSYHNLCYYINILTLKRVIPVINNYTLWTYLKSKDCKQRLRKTLTICECHQIRLNTLKVLNSVYIPWSFGNNIFQSEDLRFVYDELLAVEEMKCGNIFVNIKGEDKCFSTCCNMNTSYSDTTLEGYLCNTHKYLENYRNNYIDMLLRFREFNQLKYVNISNCRNYDTSHIESKELSDLNNSQINTNINIMCSNKTINDNVIDTCFADSVQNNFTLQPFRCVTETNRTFYKCIKTKGYTSNDNSNLQNCETFACPEPFFKCQNSFCIFPSMIGDRISDCLLADDENHIQPFLCFGEFTFVLKDICMHRSSSEYDWFSRNGTQTFICNNLCPKNYKCVSSRIKENNGTDAIVIVKSYTIVTGLYMYTNFAFPESAFMISWPLISIVAFKGSNCRVKNFDKMFQYWKFSDLLIIDLSYNNMMSCNDIKWLETFLNLKVLNISHNYNLNVCEHFIFPKTLEVIDLSHTGIRKLSRNVFCNLTQLRHLNLSYTSIGTFSDMGIPENFKLDTLYIEGVIVKHIELNFYRGLIIDSEIRASYFILCCPQVLNDNIQAHKCYAPVDNISSCKNLIGDTLKRIVIWIVGVLTVLENGIVLAYRLGWSREIFSKAYGLFISGLAVSDLIMGVYLIIIASVDVYYTDIYVFEDFNWRNGILCHFAGFLSTLSSETSTFFVCLITVDRFLIITYPFGEHRFSELGKFISFTLVWIAGFLIAVLPVVLSDWDIYSSNGLCLAAPFSSVKYKGWIFTFCVFVVMNFLLFLFIAIGQILIFIKIIKANKSVKHFKVYQRRRIEDMTVAKKLALVALTDFLCWFPIGILGFMSLEGQVFDREVHAWIAVFVLPINSALNPIIYTLPAIYNKCSS